MGKAASRVLVALGTKEHSSTSRFLHASVISLRDAVETAEMPAHVSAKRSNARIFPVMPVEA
jgi:hypothetical protein